ncbi:MAG: hypothetical protein ACUVUD_04860 [bacterium]
MKPHQPESDEERAQKILRALKAVERRELRRRFSFPLVWVLTLILILAIATVIIINIARFKMLYQSLINPDSLLGR